MTAVTSRRPVHQRFGHFRGLAFAAAICASILLLPVGTIGAGNSGVVSFTIDAVAGADVASDAGSSYTDYRIPPMDPSNCVQADQTGGMFAVFNRKIDTSGTRCSPPGTLRQFRISIDAESACTRIVGNYGSNAVSWTGAGPCELFYNDNPRVRIERLFSNQTRTAVAFLTEMTGNPISYEIRTDKDATVTTIGNTSIVTYMGTAHLWEFGTGRTRAVVDAFNLKHQMTFTRYPQ